MPIITIYYVITELCLHICKCVKFGVKIVISNDICSVDFLGTLDGHLRPRENSL